MIADGFDAVLLDLDGVLFRGAAPIEGASEAVAGLRQTGMAIAFVTNNSARTPDEVVAHLGAVGIEAGREEVETSASATASSLLERGARRAALIGERGLREALGDAGVEVVDDDGDVDAVVVGWDRRVDYDALRRASVLIQRGAAFIASNPDTSYPAPDGTRWPGAGAIAAAIAATTGVDPTVIGKPNPAILQAALARTGGSRPLVVGDRLDTDIEGAARLGWSSALVLTGISTRRDVSGSNLKPTYAIERLTDLLVPTPPGASLC